MLLPIPPYYLLKLCHSLCKMNITCGEKFVNFDVNELYVFDNFVFFVIVKMPTLLILVNVGSFAGRLSL